MSSTDTMTAEFPHGTKAGFEQGCKTNPLCPNDGITEQTCKEAATHYRSDFAYKKLVDGGMSEHEAWQQMFAEDSAPVVVAKPKPVARPKEFVEPITADADATPVVAKPARKIAAHGTTSGYSAGCRDNCPGDENGVTCRQAIAAYQREKKAERAESLRIVRQETNPAPAVQTVQPADVAETEVVPMVDAPPVTTGIVGKPSIFGADFPETAAAVTIQTGIDETIAEVKRERETRKAQAEALEEAQQTNLQLRLELDVRTSERDDARSALWTKEAEERDLFGTPLSEQDGVEVLPVEAPSILTLQVMPMHGGHEITMLGVVHPVDVALTIGASGLQHVTIIRSAAA